MNTLEQGSRSRLAQRGFTLRELLVVMLITGIVAAVAVSRTAKDPLLMSTQAEQMARDIRYVQALAMTQGQKYIFSFPAANSYRILDSTGTPVVHPFSGSNAAIILGGGATAAATIGLGGNALGFDGLGIPYSVTVPSTFNGPLTAQASIQVTVGTSSQQITITQETGKVSP